MPAIQNVGIVGSGAAGLTAAILLAEGGLDVEVLERTDGPSTVGSGITLQGNALRVFRELGVWEQMKDQGFPFSTLGLRAPDPDGTVLAVLDDQRTGGDDLPATLGMYRPELARIVRDRAEEVGVSIRYSSAVVEVVDHPDHVDVVLEDGTTRSYDLLIGADGLHSAVRQAIGIDVEPQPTGMGIWRAFVRRPAEVVQTDLVYGGPCYIAGYCPTGADSMYAYLVEDAQDRHAEHDSHIMAELAAGYGGPWKDIRTSLQQGAPVNYTKFTAHLVEGAWHRGRAVIIGDAAHSCPPTVAQGVAMAVEDAAVLAELLLWADSFDESILQEFHDRRVPRARKVVESSVQLGQWMLDGKKDADVPGLMAGVSALVSVPA